MLLALVKPFPTALCCGKGIKRALAGVNRIGISKIGIRSMATAEIVHARHIGPGGIAFRADGEYREAGGVAPLCCWLKSPGGFMHIAPPYQGLAVKQALGAFNAMPKALCQLTGLAKVKAFWLITVWSDAAVSHREADSHADKADAPGALAGYAWLFCQPATVSNADWLAAGTVLCRSFNQTSFIWRAREDPFAALLDAGGAQRQTFTAVTEILDAFAQNAEPLTLVKDNRGPLSQSPEGGLHLVADRALYAAIPHCNSSSMMFAARGIIKGGS